MSPIRTPLLRLPFWLLIAAWLCANTPQVAAWHLIVWVKNAQHFSHQAQLQVEVASLLCGKPVAKPVALASATHTGRAPAPLAPVDFTVKKILLLLVAGGGVSPPVLISPDWAEADLQDWPAHVADVPYPPPRG